MKRRDLKDAPSQTPAEYTPSESTPAPHNAVYLGNSTYEVRVDDVTVGFIYRPGSVFVALLGDRLDRAVECGQFLLWDMVAAELVTSSSQRRSP